MKDYISFDSHKHYTLAERENRKSGRVQLCKIDHSPGSIRQYLSQHCQAGSFVAVESIGSWYWIIEEIEQAGMVPLLVHPRKAKLMMGMINKTDKLDVHGLNRLQRNKSLPTVWIPPGSLRDLRELTRTRIVFVQQRTRMKNRITSTLAKYGLRIQSAKDTFAKKARPELENLIRGFPPQTSVVTTMMLEQMESANTQATLLEKRIRELVKQTEQMTLLKTIPGIGDILAAGIALEIGDVKRFANAERLASYAGTTPRVHSSGGKTHYGGLRSDANRYLRWSLSEAANSICVNRRNQPDRHTSKLYDRIKGRKGHGTAIGAVSRHLAEACFHILTKMEPYRDPALNKRSSQAGVSA